MRFLSFTPVRMPNCAGPEGLKKALVSLQPAVSSDLLTDIRNAGTSNYLRAFWAQLYSATVFRHVVKLVVFDLFPSRPRCDRESSVPTSIPLVSFLARKVQNCGIAWKVRSMTSRKRNASTDKTRRSKKESENRLTKRRQLIEALESRQLLAGPQLIGIQPNEGALIVDGTVRDVAPRVLTFGFDQEQRIEDSTLDGIRITRSGNDGQFGTDDDVQVQPGLVTVDDTNRNEVSVRFAESLPDDRYRIEVFGFDDQDLGVTGLRNTSNELFMPSDPSQRSEVIDFELRLGTLVEAVVPQPVIRLDDGSLSQNRNEIVVYFNEDELFVENDDSGNPTERSAENPRFYQLLFTQETVRTTDDLFFNPDSVVYDAATHTARLFFAGDINDLPGVPQEGGTWRLRIGTAADDLTDLTIEPQDFAIQANAVTDFQHDDLRVTFFERAVGEQFSGRQVLFENTGAGGLTARLETNGDVVFDFGGTTPEVRDLRIAVVSNQAVRDVIDIGWERNGILGRGGNLPIPLGTPRATESTIPQPVVQSLTLNAVGETLTSAIDVGVFGRAGELQSFVYNESIDPQRFAIEPIGGQDDPGHTDELLHINPDFGADSLDGITEIAYNFNDVFDTAPDGTPFLNQITERQKTRIREVLNLWSSEIGVQFRETQSEGITFALGDAG